MSNIVQRIRNLTNDEAMEAARLLAAQDVPPAKPEKVIEHIATQSIGLNSASLQSALNEATPDQVGELSRALMTYAVLSGREEDVNLAIEGAGQKLLVLEIVAVGVLVLAAYQLWQTRGTSTITQTAEMVIKPDGTITIRTVTVEENYSVGEILGNAVKAALGRGE